MSIWVCLVVHWGSDITLSESLDWIPVIALSARH